MMSGKWWLRPKDATLDVSMTEHALVARRVMLGLAPDSARFNQTQMFDSLSMAEIAEFEARGASRAALQFLSRRNDPRVYAIQRWGWVRVRRDRFYLWKLDKSTLLTIRSSDGYWSAQHGFDPNDMLDVIELSSGREFSVSLSALRDPTVDAKSLRDRSSRSIAPRRQR